MTKIIAELGINHYGSIKICKKMIDQSLNAGCWGIKFQYRNLKRNYIYNKNNSEIGLEIINREVKKNYLKPNIIKKLSNYARNLGLKVGISFFRSEDINDFKNYKFDFYKIPSAESLDIELIYKLLKKKIFLIISLGGLSEKNILFLKKNISKFLKKSNICFMHCISNYPLNPINANIGYINRLKKIFKSNKIGYSSHENNIHNCILSLTKDIDFIERHFTLNKKGNGIDHSSSSDFLEMRDLCFYAKNYKIISNSSSSKNINQGEKINIQNLGKSAISKKKILKGKKINFNHIYFSSPKIGLSKIELKNYLDKKLIADLPANTPITKDFFIKRNISKLVSNSIINKKKISIPIRPHDYEKMNRNFQLKNYEFHLSFNDVNNFNFTKIKKNGFFSKKFFTVHGPDYCSQTEILDIFSKNNKIKKKSIHLINKTINLCKLIKKETNHSPYLIQSFSNDNERSDKYKLYLKIKEFVKRVKSKHGITILPQWLPPIAWYFGGSVKMFLFTEPRDLKFLKKIKLNICMDLSHFLMSCNFFNSKFDLFYKRYSKLFSHYHLSDAQGIDSEGLQLGEGDLLKKNKAIFKKIIDNNKIKVLETWQGHLNDGLIFKNELNKISRFK